MKTTDLLILIVCLAACCTSCAKEEKLAVEIEGCWIGAQVDVVNSRHHRDEHLGLAPGVSLNCKPTFTFIRDEDTWGGKCSLSGDLAFTISNSSHSVIPASVIANGSWTTLDDDEVLVSIDPRSVSINMDPAVQSIPYSTIVGQPRTDLDSATVNELRNQHPLYLVVQRLVKSIHKIKHIRIDDQEMTAEINDIDIDFTRKNSDQP